MAEEICRRYRSEFPDEAERYGEAGMAWCRHDNLHILNWTALSLHRLGVHLDENIAWLASVLEAREFPLERLARNLELAADVVSGRAGAFDEPMAARLREAAQFVRSQPSFL